MRIQDRLAEIAQQSRGGLKNRDVLALIPEISGATLQRILEGRIEVSADTWVMYITRLEQSDAVLDEVKSLLDEAGKLTDDLSLIEDRIRRSKLSADRKVKAMKFLRDLFQSDAANSSTTRNAA